MVKILLVLLFPSLVFASPSLNQIREFKDLMHAYQSQCDGKCPAIFTAQEIFNKDFQKQGYEFIKNHIDAAANEQAQVWADTILEGDYVSLGNTRVDRVLAIYNRKNLVAYRITYSEEAYDTSKCEYNDEGGVRSEALLKCIHGRISESSFVDSDFTLLINDDSSYAEFIKD